MNKGKLIVLSGPSGVGKSTLLKRLFAKYSDKMMFSVSFTSRAPRTGEVDGVDYNFVSESQFKSKIESGDFLEYATVHGNYYGTSKSMIESILNDGKFCILDIDVQGAMLVKKTGFPARYLFVAPKNIEVLRERLETRGTESVDVIEKRITNAKKELEFQAEYDAVIINDDLETAYDNLEQFILD